MPIELLVGCLAAGALAVLTSWWALRPLGRNAEGKRRLGAFARRLPWMLSAVLLALLLAAVAVGLRGYAALTHEEVAGTFSITRADAEERFVVEWRPANAPQTKTRAVLRGDQVSMEARVLKWAPWANILGLHTHYAIDRVSGRYASVQDARRKPATAVELNPPSSLDLFAFARMLPSWVPLVDATYGSSTFIEAKDSERWSVLVSTSGLLLRPAAAERTP